MSDHLTHEEMEVLVVVAERAVWEAVTRHAAWSPSVAAYSPALQAPGAAFVTLHRSGRLAGCVGVLTPADPLVATVAGRARAAALDDPRFDPVVAADLPHLDVEVSVLSPSVPVQVHSFEELVSVVRPGVDGLTVEVGAHRATLLPAVWDDITTASAFVAALWRKAGLRPAQWSRGVRVWRYGAQLAGHVGQGVRGPAL